MPRVLVPLAPGFEELEAVTVIDLLRRAGFDVVSAGLAEGPVRGSRGTVLLPDTTLDRVAAAAVDMIVLPGGQPGSDNLAADGRIEALLRRVYDQGGWVAAICAAPKVLAMAGLLEGRRATCFPGAVESLHLPGIQLMPDPVVVDGHVVTSRGPGTALDFALTLIELIAGREARDRVEGPLQRSLR